MTGRILGIDYGKKRVGLAVTDPLRLIAGGLKTVPADEIWSFLDNYLREETVGCIVVGYPRRMNNRPSEAVAYIQPFVEKLKDRYPGIPVELVDERFTSKIALQAMIEGGVRKKARQNKSLVDTISATLILQSYLDQLSVRNNNA